MSAQGRKQRTPEELAALVESLGAKGMVAQDFGIRIDRLGEWYHQGGRIRRPGLVKLFASILTRLDNGEYWLVTPAERGRIEVEDKPFVITRATIESQDGQPMITLHSNLGEGYPLDADHPMVMEGDDAAEPRPAFRLGGNLEARISRSVFYELAAMAVIEAGRFVLRSHGAAFDLGPAADAAEAEAE